MVNHLTRGGGSAWVGVREDLAGCPLVKKSLTGMMFIAEAVGSRFCARTAESAEQPTARTTPKNDTQVVGELEDVDTPMSDTHLAQVANPPCPEDA